MNANLAKTIRQAMRADGRTVYAFARDSGLAVATVQAFAKGGDLRLATASKLCDVLGLRLMIAAKPMTKAKSRR